MHFLKKKEISVKWSNGWQMTSFNCTKTNQIPRPKISKYHTLFAKQIFQRENKWKNIHTGPHVLTSKMARSINVRAIQPNPIEKNGSLNQDTFNG